MSVNLEFGAALSDPQVEVFREAVCGRVVADFGGGDGALTLEALDAGARRVHFIDKSLGACHSMQPPVEIHRKTYAELFREKPAWLSGVEVAIVSWPPVWGIHGLPGLLLDIPEVVYVGLNVDATACGSPDLWGQLLSRKVKRNLPRPMNTLTHYGGFMREGDGFTNEEFAVLKSKVILSYAQALEGATIKHL